MSNVIWGCDRYDLVVGNGFGALPALILTQLNKYKTPTILVNPMYPPKYYLNEYLKDYKYAGFFNKYTFDTLCATVYRDPEKLKNIFVILGKDDDMTDAKRTGDYFLKDNVFYAEGGHFLKEDVLGYIDKFIGVKTKMIDMFNGNFTIGYTSPYINDGILYLYCKDGKCHAEDQDGEKADPIETASVLKAASNEIVLRIDAYNID